MDNTTPHETIEPRFLPDNFSVWEESCCRTLSEDEKDEITSHTRLFFEILRTELSSKEGKEYVYKRINKQP